MVEKLCFTKTKEKRIIAMSKNWASVDIHSIPPLNNQNFYGMDDDILFSRYLSPIWCGFSFSLVACFGRGNYLTKLG